MNQSEKHIEAGRVQSGAHPISVPVPVSSVKHIVIAMTGKVSEPSATVRKALRRCIATGGEVTLHYSNPDFIRTAAAYFDIPFTEIVATAPLVASYLHADEYLSTTWTDVLGMAKSDIEKTAKKGVKYDYSSTQVDMPPDIAEKLLAWGKKNIADEDLHDDGDATKGREDDMHVTVLYGLHTADAEDVSALLENHGPINLKLGKTGKFDLDDKDYAVVFVEVESADLKKLHTFLEEHLDNSNEFPEYKPHLTLAYVKKTAVDKYVGKTILEDGAEVVVPTLTFSSKDNKRTEIPLQEMEKAALLKKVSYDNFPDPETPSLQDGFINPNGGFFPTERHSHSTWAHTYFDCEYPELLEKGWIRISVPSRAALYVELLMVDDAQLRVLEDLYFNGVDKLMEFDLGNHLGFFIRKSDLDASGLSFAEYVAVNVKSPRKMMAEFTPSMNLPPVDPATDEMITPVAPDAVSDEETYDAPAADKPRKIWDAIRHMFTDKKAGMTRSAYWIDPNGEIYPVRDQYSTFVSHATWVDNNRELLKKKYGFKNALKMDDYELFEQMIQSGWARFGDSWGANLPFGIEVNDLRNIPDAVNDLIAKHFTEGATIEVADLGGNKRVLIDDPFPDIQKAVNKALSLQRAAERVDISNETEDAVVIKWFSDPENLNSDFPHNFAGRPVGEEESNQGEVDDMLSTTKQAADSKWWNGYCGEYAVALSERFNVPLGVIRGYFKEADEFEEEAGYQDGHVFVWVDAKTGMDAKGTRPVEQMVNESWWVGHPFRIEAVETTLEELEDDGLEIITRVLEEARTLVNSTKIKANAYTDDEMQEIYNKQQTEEGAEDGLGNGTISRDWNGNTNDIPNPKTERKPEYFDDLTEVPPYTIEFAETTPKE